MRAFSVKLGGGGKRRCSCNADSIAACVSAMNGSSNVQNHSVAGTVFDEEYRQSLLRRKGFVTDTLVAEKADSTRLFHVCGFEAPGSSAHDCAKCAVRHDPVHHLSPHLRRVRGD